MSLPKTKTLYSFKPGNDDSFPEPILRLKHKYPNLSEDFSDEDLFALLNEFNSYITNDYMTPDEFKLIMRSLNVR
jgi:hypothetical protein